MDDMKGLLWFLGLLLFFPIVLICPPAFIICSCEGLWVGAGVSGGLFVSLLIIGIIVDIKEHGFKKHMLDIWLGNDL